MISPSFESILDKVNAIWKICRNVEVHQHRCRRIHMCARDMFDVVQDMEGERGLESVVADIDSILDHVLQDIRQWGSMSTYQSVAEEDELLERIDAELKILNECRRYHLLGLEKEWDSAYDKAKARDEADLEDKLLKIAEEASELEELNPSTAMERLADEGFRRSDISHIHAKGETETSATVLELKTLSQEYTDSVVATARYQPPSLIPNDLLPVIVPLVQGPAALEGNSIDHHGLSKQQLSHLPYVTISDIKKVENVRYLHNIRDLALQVRLYGGRPMRRNGSIMTYLGSQLEDTPSSDGSSMDIAAPQKRANANLVTVQLCQVHPNDHLLYSMMQRRLLQEACTWSRLKHKNIATFLGICRYLQLGKTHIVALVSSWQARTLSDYIHGSPDFSTNHVDLYIRGRVRSPELMLNADIWSLAMVMLQIFTHKTPFENVPVHHGLVAFIVQGATPAYPSTIPNEGTNIPASASPLKRRRTSESPELASRSNPTETAHTLPSGHESHSAVSRGLTNEMWSLLQWCWEYDPRARPTIDMVVQRLKEVSVTCTVGLKNITAHVRKKSVYPVAMGGQCDIYLGEFVAHPHEKVAMKRLRMFGNCDSEPARKELIREVRLWSKLSHPNVLEFYGLYDAGGMSIYMISKWMSNGSAPDYLQKNPDANRRNIVSDALHGLCYLHGLKILHGDLKGTNILIKDDLTACLSDLGLARSSNEVTTTSLRGNGSTRYMSPEILLTDDAHGVQNTPVKTLESDVYAFGLVIRELLSDEIPYANINNIAHLVRIIASGHAPSRPENCVSQQWLCDKMWEVVQKAIHQDPAARPTAAELERQINFIPLETRTVYRATSMELDSPC
ncbi:hypothetical protein FRC07_010535 [Ceratobasidium sp. 392]|nr:hypothetical protein FRC07_010535 [Ceratobasidium sp. 392]